MDDSNRMQHWPDHRPRQHAKAGYSQKPYDSTDLQEAVNDEILRGGRHFTGLYDIGKKNGLRFRLCSNQRILACDCPGYWRCIGYTAAREIGVYKLLIDDRKGLGKPETCTEQG